MPIQLLSNRRPSWNWPKVLRIHARNEPKQTKAALSATHINLATEVDASGTASIGSNTMEGLVEDSSGRSHGGDTPSLRSSTSSETDIGNLADNEKSFAADTGPSVPCHSTDLEDEALDSEEEARRLLDIPFFTSDSGKNRTLNHRRRGAGKRARAMSLSQRKPLTFGVPLRRMSTEGASIPEESKSPRLESTEKPEEIAIVEDVKCSTVPIVQGLTTRSGADLLGEAYSPDDLGLDDFLYQSPPQPAVVLQGPLIPFPPIHTKSSRGGGGSSECLIQDGPNADATQSTLLNNPDLIFSNIALPQINPDIQAATATAERPSAMEFGSYANWDRDPAEEVKEYAAHYNKQKNRRFTKHRRVFKGALRFLGRVTFRARK